jgi:pimeloyl-ACP methyl ester carboxylesterase
MRLIRLCLLACCAAMVWVYPGHGAPGAPLQTDLPADIFAYLDEPDAGLAEQGLQRILRRADTAVDEVRRIIQTERSYAAERVGTMPDESILVRDRPYHYALSVPAAYQSAKAYGLVVCLHGAGFTGQAYLDRWQSRLGDEYVLVCPTYPAGAWFTRAAEELVLAVIHRIQSRYHIDPDRVFLTGMSNGGIGTWLIGMHHAPLFAGIAPMASGLDDVLMPFLANLRNTPVYMIHGAKDRVMPVDLSRSIARELAALGYPHTYREHDREHPMAGGHYFPREELPDLVRWFHRQRRDPMPARLTLVREASRFYPFGWVRIDATDSIAAFSDDLITKRDDHIKGRDYAKLDAMITAANRIEVTAERVQRYSLFLNDELIDVTKPVTVVTNGEVSFEGPVTPSVETMLRQARLRQDPRQLFSVHLTISMRKPPA